MLKKYHVDPTEIFCPPHLPDHYKYFKYHEDHKKGAHFTDAWHWVHNTSYTQFYDAMCLYKRIRTVHGNLTSVKLNNVLIDNGLTGKLHFPDLKALENKSETDWHRYMQVHEFYRYIVYNQADVIWIQLMEWVNHDANNLLILSDNSHLSKFPRQTVKFCETLFIDWVDKGYILGVSSSDMTGEYDDETLTVGGAVLPPNRIDQAGLACMEEFPHIPTQIYGHAQDLDFSSLYPSIGMAINVSRETKLATMYHIRGDHVQSRYKSDEAVEVFCSYVACLDANAVSLGTEFFHLPNFTDMDALFAEHHKPQSTDDRGPFMDPPSAFKDDSPPL
jgi:hypothetical protein